MNIYTMLGSLLLLGSVFLLLFAMQDMAKGLKKLFGWKWLDEYIGGEK